MDDLQTLGVGLCLVKLPGLLVGLPEGLLGIGADPLGWHFWINL